MFLENMINQMKAALAQVPDKETLIGGVLLSEVVFGVVKPNFFQTTFE